MVLMATYRATLARNGGDSGWPSLLPCRGHEYIRMTVRREEEFARARGQTDSVGRFRRYRLPKLEQLEGAIDHA